MIRCFRPSTKPELRNPACNATVSFTHKKTTKTKANKRFLILQIFESHLLFFDVSLKSAHKALMWVELKVEVRKKERKVYLEFRTSSSDAPWTRKKSSWANTTNSDHLISTTAFSRTNSFTQKKLWCQQCMEPTNTESPYASSLSFWHTNSCAHGNELHWMWNTTGSNFKTASPCGGAFCTASIWRIIKTTGNHWERNLKFVFFLEPNTFKKEESKPGSSF